MGQGGWRGGGDDEWAKQGWRSFPVLWDNSRPGDVVNHGVMEPSLAGKSSSPELEGRRFVSFHTSIPAIDTAFVF